MKPMTAEKSKPVSKPSSKVFDIAHPGKGSPSATARPVIVSNRPLLQDPMVSTPTEMEQEKPQISPTESKVVIKPLEEAELLHDTTAHAAKDEKDKTIAELAADKSQESAAGKPTEAAAGPDDGAEPAAEKAAKTEPEAKADTPQKSAPNSETSDAQSDSEELTIADKDAVETARLEAEAKKLEAINALVEGKQYFLPINAVERHRSKVMTALGLVLILALGALLFDLLLDVGFIQINGVQPLTHFFSA